MSNLVPPSEVATHGAPSSASASRTLPYVSHVAWRKKLVVVLVGLPARGKSYVATKIVNWLRWRGSSAELFNVGKQRRAQVTTDQSSEFFSPENQDAASLRDQLAFECLDRLLLWLREGGDLAVLDATNTTRKRRAEVLRRIEAVSPVLPVVFIESICTDPVVLHQNYLAKVTHSPDYRNMPLKDALEDLKRRVDNYLKVYEPVDEDHSPSQLSSSAAAAANIDSTQPGTGSAGVREDVSYIKLMNLASKIICNRIHGSLMHSICAFLMSIHVKPRPIYLSRAGRCVGAADESLFDLPQTSSLPAASSPAVGTTATVPSSATTATAVPPSSQTVASHPVLIPYAQSEAADLDESGKKYAELMNTFVADQVLEYWHKHLVSRRAENPCASPTATTATAASPATTNVNANDANASSPHQQTQDSSSSTSQQGHLSPNELASASVFSPPASSPSSPQLNASRDLGAPLVPPSSSSTDSAGGTDAGGMFLPERSTAIIGSGSMVLTLERSHTNDTLPLVVYTSTLPRALQSVSVIASRALYVQQQSSLNALDHGTLTGLTFQEIQQQYPEESEAWLSQRYSFRFPGGESQQDKARALESLMMELERQLFPVLIVSHASTLQVLLGYFSNLPCNDYSSIKIPQHVLIELIPSSYGWQETFYDFSALTPNPRVLHRNSEHFSHTQNFYAS